MSTLVDPSRPQRISLAYRDISYLPRDVVQKYKDTVTELDLSHNRFAYMIFLLDFEKLNSLILDNNNVNSHVKFPYLSSLETLWVNHNSISNLSVFVEMVAKSFPKLKFLSMMDNQAAPSYFNGGTYAQYKDYRLYVISHLPNLAVLDDECISNHEREEAQTVYGSRRYSVHSKRKSHKKANSGRRNPVDSQSDRASLQSQQENT